MKRFTVVTALFSISLLVAWLIFQPSAASTQMENNAAGSPVDSGNEVLVPVTAPEVRNVAPVYDANGDLVSDPTGTVSNTNDPRNMTVAPVFDSSGAVISNPSGILLHSVHP